MNNRMKTSLMLLLGGLIALGAGIFFTVYGNNMVASATEPATATVVEYAEGTVHDSNTNTEDTVYYPVVTYEVDGEMITSQYSQYEYGETYQTGETVEIKYNPDDPEEFILVEDTGRLKHGTVWEIPLGVVLIIVALVRIFVPGFMAGKQRKD